MRYRGKRCAPFVALTILHRLVSGLEDIHDRGEYHADVHTENILIRQTGVDFELKLIDFYDWGRSSRAKQQNDILQAVRVLYDMIGGAKGYRTATPGSARRSATGCGTTSSSGAFRPWRRCACHLEEFEPTVLP